MPLLLLLPLYRTMKSTALVCYSTQNTGVTTAAAARHVLVLCFPLLVRVRARRASESTSTALRYQVFCAVDTVFLARLQRPAHLALTFCDGRWTALAPLERPPLYALLQARNLLELSAWLLFYIIPTKFDTWDYFLADTQHFVRPNIRSERHRLIPLELQKKKKNVT